MTRATLVNWIAGIAAVAVVATIAVVAAGYDARETPREEGSVWVVRSTGQYARVNTLTAEIDTVRQVDDPSGIVQAGARGAVLTQGNGRVWAIDPTLPADLEDGAESESLQTPQGTREVLAEGESVLFHTESGEAYLSDLAAGLKAPRRLDSASETPVRADAVALDIDGRVALYTASGGETASGSVQSGSVQWFDARRGGLAVDASTVPSDVPANVQLAIVSGRWAMLDPDTGRLWREGQDDPVQLDAQGAPRLQASSAVGDDVLVADEAGLWRIGGSEGRTAERVVDFEGAPAQPMQVGDAVYAAWLGQLEGRLWSSTGDEAPLQVDESVTEPDNPELTIRSNGASALVSESQSGMLWRVPDGRMIPVEQWTLNEPPRDREGAVTVDDAKEQEPPVALADAFGVRPGEPAPLPVLLNDFDPNRRDVLTIVPEGLGEELPEEFGEVSMLADGQSLVVRPAEGASGSASFSYRVTDGALMSEPATVTLTVADPAANTAPAWCPVEGCQREWPAPEITPGGTLVLPVLEGWVDPEGDPMVLESATAEAGAPLRALVTADGRLAVRHNDPEAADGEVAVTLRIADSRGETAERDLKLQIRENAVAELPPIAASVLVGETAALHPLSRVVGGSGSLALVDASVQSGSARVVANPGSGSIEVTARAPGVTTVLVTVRDTVTDSEITGVLRVTAADETARLGLPPLRAFVRPLADTTVDVLSAVPGGRSLAVGGVSVVDGELRADVIEHAHVRVSGSTPDGAPGRIGAADITVLDGDATATGRLTVFLVPDAGYAGAIAVADTATVRAGSVADIAVLDNDVAPPGQRLVLHPRVNGSGAEGELAFASGNTLRYLAPSEPGTYTLGYTAYSASSPDDADVGQVRVTVLPRDGNRNPLPRSLTVRLAPGERASVPVPLSGVDPDGDRVRLTGVTARDDSQLAATLAPRTSAIQVSASPAAEAGVRSVSYSVRDEFGGEADGTLRVIIADSDRGAPVTYSDYVRLAAGVQGPVSVTPLDNDLDPAGGSLSLIEVVPNVPGGENSEQYRELADRLDASQIREGRVKVLGSEEPGTISYRYTVRSSVSKSTADGLIVVQVSGRVGQQAPTVQDTVLSARDRAELAGGGVDVVTDRVRWTGGDVDGLKMSLWGPAAGDYTANGKRISGSYRAEGDVVPFKLAGTDLSGEQVETFGFLVIPPLDELRLSLAPGLSPISVPEGGSVDVALADVVDLAPGDRAEFMVGDFPTQRGQAVCEAVGPSALRYSAGDGAPWADTCVVSVKLEEQTAWTRLALPIGIVPNQPVAELRAMTRTVAPGASQTVDLTDMVGWQGGRVGDASALRFEISGGGPNFEIAQAGAQLTVTAGADATPGAQDALTVSVDGGSHAALTLRVGEAARDAPRGAVVSMSCTVGSDCRAQLIGVSGEYDPFAGRSGGGLRLDSIAAGSCAAASFQADGGGVRVVWRDARGAGESCSTTFTVRDAQNRIGQGAIELDALGVPPTPAGITTVGYTAQSVTLQVALGGSSYPATDEVRISAQGAPISVACTPGEVVFTCEVGGLTASQQRTFTAVAVNRAGESDPVSTVSWAYVAPSVQPVVPQQLSAESTSSATARFALQGGPGTTGFRIVTAAGERQVKGQSGSVDIAGLSVGTSEFRVTPLAATGPPTGGAAEGEQFTGQVTLGGLPKVTVQAVPGAEPDTIDVTVQANANGGAGVQHGYSWNGAACTADRNGASGTYTITESPVTQVTACASNSWGSAQPVTVEVPQGG